MSIHYQLKHDSNSSHQQIAAFVRHAARGPILDVGSAQGMLAQLLASSGLAIDAIEPNPVWAEAARPMYRHMHIGTVESAPVPDEKYRVIVCADVLEHTADPVSVLRQLADFATDDALFIVSLPNVAHIAVRVLLLLGRFPQMQRGILDRTHLHHYTRDTAAQMLHDSGLVVDRVSSTTVPLRDLSKASRPSWLLEPAMKAQTAACWVAPRLFAMQWIYFVHLDRGLRASSQK